MNLDDTLLLLGLSFPLWALVLAGAVARQVARLTPALPYRARIAASLVAAAGLLAPLQRDREGDFLPWHVPALLDAGAAHVQAAALAAAVVVFWAVSIGMVRLQLREEALARGEAEIPHPFPDTLPGPPAGYRALALRDLAHPRWPQRVLAVLGVLLLMVGLPAYLLCIVFLARVDVTLPLAPAAWLLGAGLLCPLLSRQLPFDCSTCGGRLQRRKVCEFQGDRPRFGHLYLCDHCRGYERDNGFGWRHR